MPGSQPSIHQKIQDYYVAAAGEHHRHRSWEHCYSYFRRARRRGLAAERDLAALQLGFYLASWGMYRGSGFLYQHAYTVHRGIVDLIADRRFNALWGADFGAKATDKRFLPAIRELIDGVRERYTPFAPNTGSRQPTDTLITKVVLGTFGCLPACDRYFVDGFKSGGFKYSSLNDAFVERVHGHCGNNLAALRREQVNIEKESGMRYPLMKLVDMYFWQIGYEQDTTSPRRLTTADGTL